MAEGNPGGIPSGLNRIRTRRAPPEDLSSSGGDDSPAPIVERAGSCVSARSGAARLFARNKAAGVGNPWVDDGKGQNFMLFFSVLWPTFCLNCLALPILDWGIVGYLMPLFWYQRSLLT